MVKSTVQLDERSCEISDFIEKPGKEEAPSNLACLGRYVLSGKIFKYLEKTEAGKGGEIQLIDGILKILQDGKNCCP